MCILFACIDWLSGFAVCSVFSAVLIVFYLLTEPTEDPGSLLLHYCNWQICSCVLVVVLGIFAYSHWQWPVSFDSVWYDVFVIKVGGLDSAAHVWSYMSVPIMFVVSYVFLRFTVTRSFLVSIMLMSFHEIPASLFWYLFNWSNVDWVAHFSSDAGFLLILVVAAVLYQVRYGIGRKLMLFSLVMLAYDYFRVVALDASLNGDFVEVTSWWILLIFISYSLRDSKIETRGRYFAKSH